MWELLTPAAWSPLHWLCHKRAAVASTQIIHTYIHTYIHMENEMKRERGRERDKFVFKRAYWTRKRGKTARRMSAVGCINTHTYTFQFTIWSLFSYSAGVCWLSLFFHNLLKIDSTNSFATLRVDMSVVNRMPHFLGPQNTRILYMFLFLKSPVVMLPWPVVDMVSVEIQLNLT